MLNSRNKVKTTELGSIQKSRAQAQLRHYTCNCKDNTTELCSIEKIYGNHGVPLHSAGDLVAFMKASTEKTAYNASLCKHLQEKRQTCINMCTRIKLQ